MKRARAASADVDDEIAGPEPCVSDELLRPMGIELMPSPGAPWHGHGDGRPSRGSQPHPPSFSHGRAANCAGFSRENSADGETGGGGRRCSGRGARSRFGLRGLWLRALDAVEPQASFALPSRAHAEGLLIRLAVPDDDLEAVLSVWPEPDRDVELWWLLERCQARSSHRWATATLSSTARRSLARARPQGSLLLGLRVRGDGRGHPAFHVERGVPDDISWATLADLGQQLVIHRKRRGTTGLDLQWWLVPHFLGALYALGRLQFHLYHLRVGIAGPAFWPDTDEPGFRKGTRRSACTSPRLVLSRRTSATRHSTSRGSS